MCTNMTEKGMINIRKIEILGKELSTKLNKDEFIYFLHFHFELLKQGKDVFEYSVFGNPQKKIQ